MFRRYVLGFLAVTLLSVVGVGAAVVAKVGVALTPAAAPALESPSDRRSVELAQPR